MEHLWKVIAAAASVWAIISTTLRVAANRELSTSRNLMREIWPVVKSNQTKIQAQEVASARCSGSVNAKLDTLIAEVQAIKDRIFNGD